MIPQNSTGRPPAFRPASRVLIVDDEPLIRWSLGEQLMRAGYRVAEAGTAAGALGCFEDGGHPFGVVFLDLRLPDSTDLRVLAEILRRSPGTRVIIMTAHGTPELAAEAQRLGAWRVLDKPFDLDDMVRLARAALANGGAHGADPPAGPV